MAKASNRVITALLTRQEPHKEYELIFIRQTPNLFMSLFCLSNHTEGSETVISLKHNVAVKEIYDNYPGKLASKHTQKPCCPDYGEKKCCLHD